MFRTCVIAIISKFAISCHFAAGNPHRARVRKQLNSRKGGRLGTNHIEHAPTMRKAEQQKGSSRKAQLLRHERALVSSPPLDSAAAAIDLRDGSRDPSHHFPPDFIIQHSAVETGGTCQGKQLLLNPGFEDGDMTPWPRAKCTFNAENGTSCEIQHNHMTRCNQKAQTGTGGGTPPRSGEWAACALKDSSEENSMCQFIDVLECWREIDAGNVTYDVTAWFVADEVENFPGAEKARLNVDFFKEKMGSGICDPVNIDHYCHETISSKYPLPNALKWSDSGTSKWVNMGTANMPLPQMTRTIRVCISVWEDGGWDAGLIDDLSLVLHADKLFHHGSEELVPEVVPEVPTPAPVPTPAHVPGTP